MMKNMSTVTSAWRTVLLVLVVAAIDVLLSFMSLGLGLEDGTVPEVAESFSQFARFAFAPVLAPLGAVALVWRHRFPRSVAAATAVLAAMSLSGVAFIVALFLLAKRRLDWWVAAVIALAIAMEALVGLEAMSWQYLTVLSLLLYGAIAGWGAYRGQRVRLRESRMAALQGQAERAAAERAGDAERTRLAERHRIAREMHDTLAHRMSLVAVQAAALQVDAPNHQTAVSAAVIRDTAHAALGELREVLGVLRDDGTAAQDGAPGTYAPSGIAQIAGLVAQWRLAGMAVAYSPSFATSEQIPDAVSRAVFRVVQEGLTNVARHAPESDVEVCLQRHRDDGNGAAVLEVTVTNSAGGPAQAAPGSGLGLVGLAERVQLLGGTLDHGPRKDGFELAARITLASLEPGNDQESVSA